MTFQDDLRETIQAAKAASEDHDQAGRNFDTQWREAREGFIWQLFSEAVKVLQSEGIPAQRELVNGGSIVLHASWNARAERFLHALTFSADQKKRQVICSADLDDFKEEPFTLEHLTEAAVQAKITQFAGEITRGGAPRPSVYEKRGFITI